MSYKKREYFGIISQILESVMDTPLKKTGISYRTRLDNRLTSQYLRLMEDVELVKKSDFDESMYAITPKGVDFRNRLDEIIAMLDLPEESLMCQLD